MPNEETTGGTDTQTQNPTDVGAADIAAELEAERQETEQSESKKEEDVTDADETEEDPKDEDGETPEKTEEETPEEEADEDDDEETVDTAPGEEKSFDESDLVGSTEKALTEAGYGKLAEVIKREWDWMAPIAETVDQCYADPDRAKAEVPGFIRELALRHGLDIREILGDELIDSLDEPTFSSEMEKRTWHELQAMKRERAAEKRTQTEEAARAKADATLAAHAKEVTPGVQKALEKRYDGWKPTTDQVAEALREFPQFRDRPVRAVEAMYPRQIAQHARKSAAKTAPKASNELGGSVDVAGIAIPDDPLDLKAHHAAAMRNR